MTRILNRQRQLAEQGRLRLGYTVPYGNGGKTRPVASKTWVITSHSQEHAEAAAQLWGGTAERWQPMGNGAEQWRVISETNSIDAILPPNEPLNQAYELWGRGGATRRCDGATEQFSGSPCLCLAQFGDKWYEQKAGTVCDTVSRLKVILPDMPGLGTWRVDTGSFYAADEMAAMIDVIRAAVGNTLVPVKLRIEPRTRTANGETSQFVVPVLELRAVTAGQLLGGHYQGIASIEGHQDLQQRAITASAEPIPDYLKFARQAVQLEQVQALWREAQANGHLTEELKTQLMEIGNKLAPVNQEPPPSQSADELWQIILRESGEKGYTLDKVMDEFPQVCGGVDAQHAGPQEMMTYLTHIRSVTA